ncbi:Mov34/MPN/PAD-1 family protein [Dechloromonas agitata]|uniref:Mov34/MPN/PAD-1 family protein n=1 Tax=Dechloromonas agitata TaxID=73030 RepID=UPI0012F892D7|nr:Mov34/MPN/PAD-1 family protein [Dechloromonas agitata]
MRSAMIWPNPFETDGKVLIEGAVIDLVLDYQQRGSSTPEAGGIFLGYRRGIHLHIVQATTPQPRDRRMRYRFDRYDQFHQAIASKQWEESDGTVDYVGEWHTHPEVNPSPSSLDISEWGKIHRTRQFPMIFLIVGLAESLWIGLGCNNKIVRL